jgi:pimeloyl-ACP methyl ester carboxylesterase
MVVVGGEGPPIVVIPGIQGRWRWMAPLVDALARRHRVVTFSLNEARGDRLFDRWCDLVDRSAAAAGSGPVAIAGMSFGGLIALRYAASRPNRTSHLVLISTPSPRWRPDAASLGYADRPWRSLPAFLRRTRTRLAPELATAFPQRADRTAFSISQTGRLLRAPQSPARMADWIHAWMAEDLTPDSARVTAPTLVVTGEPALDRVVPVESSLEYLSLITGAEHAVIADTGHLGVITKPDVAAGLIGRFLAS